MALRDRLLIDISPLRTSREFRYLFTARAVSILGIGFLMVALPVQMYDLTGSTTQVAAVAAVFGAATFVATFLGGVLADRCDRRRLIMLARGTAGVFFAVLAINAVLPEPQTWVLYLCAVVDGVCGGISVTALMAVTPSLIPRDKLAAAGALVALTGNIGALAGPALGGVVIAVGGVGVNYTVAAVATAVTTFCISRLPSLPPPGRARESPVASVISGYKYALGDRVVGGVLIAGFVSMLLAGWTVFIPEYATEVLGVGPSVIGLLYAAPAVGALLGSLTSGWTSTVQWSGRVIFGGMLISATGLAGAGATAAVALVVVGLATHGFGDTITDIMRYAVIQRGTPDKYRGRIAGVWSAQMTAGASIGAIAAGAVSFLVPISAALVVYGLIGCVLTLVLCAWLRTLRGVNERTHVNEEVTAASGRSAK
ncbi:enterobactin transporter EntS [Hoyosella subflava]|uniref:Multidrug efflux pump Tap n=1 Tax=Hoyosella subflava (strain DSM 45089 / JCM 17490 / NBRC 109087 / DQS3-9A1) TaxID=443218 RepID=F6EEF0_HOYSD|nr:enterobactin transporter EntS [Hoyosella subflava]AEF38602.1 Putative siderophore export protein [Hoyosella subflava DQS3-9A1]